MVEKQKNCLRVIWHTVSFELCSISLHRSPENNQPGITKIQNRTSRPPNYFCFPMKFNAWGWARLCRKHDQASAGTVHLPPGNSAHADGKCWTNLCKPSSVPATTLMDGLPCHDLQHWALCSFPVCKASHPQTTRTNGCTLHWSVWWILILAMTPSWLYN